MLSLFLWLMLLLLSLCLKLVLSPLYPSCRARETGVEVSAAGYPLPIEESPVLGVREILVLIRIRGSYGSGYGRPKNLWFPNIEGNKTKNADPAFFFVDSGIQELKETFFRIRDL
jgi:hypothetical protein